MGRPHGRRIRTNMGRADHWLRLGLAVVLVVLGLIVGPLSWLSIVLFVVAAVLLATATLSFCPVYWLFGVQTCRRELAGPESEPGRH